MGQRHVSDFAKPPDRHYILKANPLLRLHADSRLHTGDARIETSLGGDPNAEGGGVMATQAISAEQLAQLRAQLPPRQQLPGITNANNPASSQLVAPPPATNP